MNFVHYLWNLFNSPISPEQALVLGLMMLVPVLLVLATGRNE